MAFEVKLGQHLALRQQLVMTPQLQQAIKILQLSLPELESLIQGELEQNPMLEPLDRSATEAAADAAANNDDGAAPQSADGSGSDADAPVPEKEFDTAWETSLEERPPADGVAPPDAHDAAVELKELGALDKLDWREYAENYANNWQDSSRETEKDDDSRPSLENASARRTSLDAHLMWQLQMSDLCQADQRIGGSIIYNLNDDGYLETPLEEIAGQLEVDAGEVARVLAGIQLFDPPGVAARDLRECLMIQLANHGMEQSIAARIVEKHLDLLEKHRYAEIARTLSVSNEMVAQAARAISVLEPKPGRDYGGQEPAYIVPDVFIQKFNEDYIVTLNEAAVPRLRLSGYYQRVLHDGAIGAETRDYLSDRLRSARWLVKSIYQRQQTVFKVASSIIKFQRAFFDHGISHLRPLVLKDVARDIRMHESTISRATANKYAHTPQGIFELRFFFTSGVQATTGEDVSAETVKEKIRMLVAAEARRNPLSDQAIVELLRRDQIEIARRTVAKYRQALGILPSARRKQPD